MNTNHRITRQVLALLAALLLVLPALGGKPKNTVSDSDRRKASYIFLEALNEKSHNREDSYFDLLRRAHEIDPSNTAVSYHLGYCMLTMQNTTRERVDSAMALMKQHYEAHPEDFYESTFYSDANLMLGNPEEALRALKRLNDANPNRLELQVRLAEAQFRSGKYLESVATYDSIEALHGKSMTITTKKINNFYALNDTAAALAEMHSLLATAPDNASYNITMAGLMQQFALNDSALHYLDAALRSEPDNGYAYLAKAEYYQMQGDSAAYDQQIRHALVSENLDVETKVEVLASYIRDEIVSQSSNSRINQLLDVLVEQHPHEVPIHQLYSEYLIATDDYEHAAEQLGYVLDINPTDADTWRKLMIVDMMAENYPQAIAAAERAMEYNPDNMDLYRYIAPAYYQMKKYDLALATYERALSLTDSTDVELRSSLYGGMGDTYFEMGDTVRSFESYEKSLEIYPTNAGILNNYAYFLALSERDLDKAERMSAKAVQLSPDNATYLDTYAWVFFKQKNYSMALLYIKSAVDNDGDKPSADLLDHYGDILFMNGETEAAVEQWKKALELLPDNELLQRKVQHGTIFMH